MRITKISRSRTRKEQPKRVAIKKSSNGRTKRVAIKRK